MLLAKEIYEKEPFGKKTVRDFVVSMSNGATPSRKNNEFWIGGSIPWVKTGEVNNNLIIKTEESITELALEKTSVKLLPKDTLIMALYGSGTAGRLALLQTPATTNQACTAMICETPAHSFYLFVTLQGLYRKIDSLTRGSVQQNLSKNIIADLKIPDISNAKLEELGLSNIYKHIASNTKELLFLSELRDALLPKLMSGEIDVSGIS